MVRQARLERDTPDLRFLQLAHRKHHARELFARQPMQKVALVLGGVDAAKQAIAAIHCLDPRVVAGGDLLSPQAHRVVEERLELDLGVAQHIGVRRAAGSVLTQEFGEHAVLVFGGEIHRLELDADDIGRGRGVDQVLAGRAVLVGIVVLPVLHEEADDDFHANSAERSSSG